MQPTSALHHHAETSSYALPQIVYSGRNPSNQPKKYLFPGTKKLRLNGIDEYTGEGVHDTLDITFDPYLSFVRKPLCFDAFDMAYGSDRPWRATHAQPIRGAKNCYRATLEMHSSKSLQVAIKFGEGFDERDDLLKEAYFYNKELKRAQGKFVPEYIGVFHMSTPRPDKTLPLLRSCLVLTYVGEPLTCYMRFLPPKRR